jgi:hypothetical protein
MPATSYSGKHLNAKEVHRKIMEFTGYYSCDYCSGRTTERDPEALPRVRPLESGLDRACLPAGLKRSWFHDFLQLAETLEVY